jgi:hypothetical protein
MRQASLITGLSLVLLLGASACARAEEEPVDPRPGFIRELQKAVAADDKKWMADHLHLPVRYFGKTAQIIRSKDWFLKHYATVIGPELKANVLAQDPEKYFMNYQGLMVGEGSHNIWFKDFGDVDAGHGVHFEIITINNSR